MNVDGAGPHVLLLGYRSIASTLLLSRSNQSEATSRCINILHVNFSRWAFSLAKTLPRGLPVKFRLFRKWTTQPSIIPWVLVRCCWYVSVWESPRLRTEHRRSYRAYPVLVFYFICRFFFCIVSIFLCIQIFVYNFFFLQQGNEMELNSLLILLEAAEYLERRDRGICSFLYARVTSLKNLL